MSIWVRLEDITSVALLMTKATPDDKQLVRFHLLIPMGYVESATFFCATTKKVKDRALDILSMRHTAPPGRPSGHKAAENHGTRVRGNTRSRQRLGSPVPARAGHSPIPRQSIPRWFHWYNPRGANIETTYDAESLPHHRQTVLPE